jgi:hypothetical protein
MSLFTDGQTKIFPLEWVKKCVETYAKDHGEAPKILVVSAEDYLDYKINCTLAMAGQLNLQVTYADYLQSGEIDLASGIKEE